MTKSKKTPKHILNNVEREYLKAIIHPFKKKVAYVMKCHDFKDKKYEYIQITLNNDVFDTKEYCILPKYEKNKYYKNMECDKVYTLEDLEL